MTFTGRSRRCSSSSCSPGRRSSESNQSINPEMPLQQRDNSPSSDSPSSTCTTKGPPELHRDRGSRNIIVTPAMSGFLVVKWESNTALL